jgi:hypothetical protein
MDILTYLYEKQFLLLILLKHNSDASFTASDLQPVLLALSPYANFLYDLTLKLLKE